MENLLSILFPQGINPLIRNGNTGLVTITKEVCGGNPENPTYMDVFSLSAQEGEDIDGQPSLPDVAFMVLQKYNLSGTECNPIKNVLETELFIGNSNEPSNTYNPVKISLTSKGVMKIVCKKYSTIQDAQSDSNLEVGELYMCDGAYRYKE